MHSRLRGPTIPKRAAWLAGALLLCSGSCRLPDTPGLRRPAYDVQRRAILELVPLGTRRDEAVGKIEEAGIAGEFGISDSVYYCDFWKRQGEQWYLDVALYFDQSGRLYKIGPGQSEIGPVPGADEERDDQARGAASTRAVPSGEPSDGAAEESPSSARGGRRVPFANPADLR